MEGAALDGAVSRSTGVAVFIDVDAFASGAVPDPAAMGKIRSLRAVGRSRVDEPSAAWRDANDVEPVFSLALPSIAQLSGARDVERADGQPAIKALTGIEAAVAKKQLFYPEAAIVHSN